MRSEKDTRRKKERRKRIEQSESWKKPYVHVARSLLTSPPRDLLENAAPWRYAILLGKTAGEEEGNVEDCFLSDCEISGALLFALLPLPRTLTPWGRWTITVVFIDRGASYEFGISLYDGYFFIIIYNGNEDMHARTHLRTSEALRILPNISVLESIYAAIRLRNILLSLGSIG